MGNGKRISITKARKEPMIISVSSAMNEEQYKGCFKLLPDSIKDFNKYEFSRGTRVRCNVYVLGDGDFACVRSSDKLVGEYEEVQSKAISLPTELEDKCDYLSRYYCFCDCKKEIETIKSLKEFFEGRSDKDDRIIVDAFNYELQEAIQRCRGEYPKTSINQAFYLDLQPKQNRFEALAFAGSLYPDSRNFFGPWDGGNPNCFGTAYGLEAYLGILEFNIPPKTEFKVSRIKRLA